MQEGVRVFLYIEGNGLASSKLEHGSTRVKKTAHFYEEHTVQNRD